ncbi:helix-turn-helix domain-containing protein [Kribbella alba]|uniref:Helix-turn-helix domain-containing protein n=1 Tax=Kribbella alba TaxID=190197 RepID=A0ABN2FJK2_9ACTN
MAARTPARRDAQTLREVIRRLGPSLITVAVAPDGSLDRSLAGVCVHDPLLEVEQGQGEALLAVGVDPRGEDAVELVQRAAAQGYAAIVLHVDDTLPEQVAVAARRRRIVILTAPTDVPWVHLATMLRVGISSAVEELAGAPLGDLFAFANSLAQRIRGAVTIEDPQSHVLAYSSVTKQVDEPRKETILGRRVPQKYMRLLQERGVFRQLISSDDVVHMEAMPEVQLSRRVAISVRAAGELLGSIWVAEKGEPLAEDQSEILREAALTAALHIMRHRLDLHAESNLRRSMVRDLLDGTAADVAAVRLALAPDAPYVVVAFEALGGSLPGGRLLQVIDLYCSTVHRVTVALDVSPRVYVVVSGAAIAREIRQFASEAARRVTGATQAKVYAAIGRPVTSFDRVVESRQDVDRVMRVLLRPETRRTVADLDDVRAAANLLEVLDLVRERPHLLQGPLRLLAENGSARDLALVSTLRAYLDYFGDVSLAAGGLQVHPNTFRYRLRRATDVLGIDLDDPTERLMLALQLRLLR